MQEYKKSWVKLKLTTFTVRVIITIIVNLYWQQFSNREFSQPYEYDYAS